MFALSGRILMRLSKIYRERKVRAIAITNWRRNAAFVSATNGPPVHRPAAELPTAPLRKPFLILFMKFFLCATSSLMSTQYWNATTRRSSSSVRSRHVRWQTKIHYEDLFVSLRHTEKLQQLAQFSSSTFASKLILRNSRAQMTRVTENSK